MPLHLRSTRPSFPSPPPRRGWQRSNHCPQSFGPRITRQPVRVGTPGHRRARSGSASPSSILLHEPSEMPQECACSSPGRNISPKGVLRCRASSKTRSPYEAGNAAIACVSARPAERPRQLAGLPAPALPGCQPIAGDHGGAAPKPPGAAVPRGSAWVGRWKDPTAARSKPGALHGAPSRGRVRWLASVPRVGRV